MNRRSLQLAIGTLLGLLACSVLLLANASIFRMAGNTVWLVIWVVCISLCLGTPLAFAITRARIPFRGLATSLVAGLLFVPLYLQASAWQSVWGAQGWFTLFFGQPALSGWPAVIWIHSAAAIPWVVLITGFGFARVEAELEEDALLDASPGRVFFSVTLRRSWTAIGAAALWVAAGAAGEMTVTNLYQVPTLAEVSYLQYAGSAESEEATQRLLLGTTGLAICMAISLGLFLARMNFDRHTSTRLDWEFPLSGARRWLNAFDWIVLAGLIAVPLAGLIHKAGIVVTPTNAGWSRTWSAKSAIAMVSSSPGRFSREIEWSLLIGVVTATIATFVALLLAIASRKSLGRWITLSTLCFALVIPGPLIGVALIQLFHLFDSQLIAFLYDRSITAPVLAQLVKALPLATLVLWPAVTNVPRELLESAAVDGAGRIGLFWHVIWPLVRRSVVVAWLVALAVSLGDLAASILVMPPGVETLAIHIFGLIHYGVDDRVAGITLAMVGAFVAIGVVVQWLACWRTSRGMMEG